jgi:hypothetical protein
MNTANGQTSTTPGQAMTLAPPREEPPVQVGAQPTAYERQLEPAGFGDAMKLCESIARSKICGVTSPDDALVRLMTGRSLGLTAMQSLRGVYVVKGRPALDASLMMALAMAHPECERFEFIETSATRAVLAVKRLGRAEQQIVWTMDMAQQTGNVKPDSAWAHFPAHMLRARCKADGARLEFPDVLFGLYSPEELHDGVIDTTGEIVDAGTLRDGARAAEAAQVAKIEADKVRNAGVRVELLMQLGAIQTQEDRKAFAQGIAPGGRRRDPSGVRCEVPAEERGDEERGRDRGAARARTGARERAGRRGLSRAPDPLHRQRHRARPGVSRIRRPPPRHRVG